MAKTIDLAAEINKILEDYGDNVTDNIKEVTKKVTQQGAKAVKANAKNSFKGTGQYAKGWSVKMEEDYFSATGIIYNKTPGLPHLLEHGHANRGGGRTPGRVHIGNAEDNLVKEFEDAVKRVL